MSKTRFKIEFYRETMASKPTEQPKFRLWNWVKYLLVLLPALLEVIDRLLKTHK